MKPFEIIKQHDLKDCGACALLSIIKHYGGSIPLEKLRIDTHTSLEGTTAYHIIKAAKSYGFDSYGLYLESFNDLKNVYLPAIAHVEINHLKHFVVIYKIQKNKIELMDPAKGKVKLKINEFTKIWTKNLILFYPKYTLPKINTKNFFNTFFLQILKSEKKFILNMLLLTIFFTFLTIFTSFYFKIGNQYLNEIGIQKILFYVAFLFFFLILLKIMVYYLKNYFKTILNKHIDGLLYHSFLNRLFLLPNYFIKDRTTGEIMIRLNELSNFKLFYSEFLTTICIDSILIIGIGIILCTINIHLFFILCFFSMIYLLYGLISGKLLYKKALNTNELEVDFQAQVVENLDTIITLKNINVLKKSLKKLEVKLIHFLQKNVKLNAFILNSETILFFIEELLQFSIITFGFLEIQKARLSIVDLITYLNLLNYFIDPFKRIIEIIPNYNCIKVSIEKINDFFTLELEDSQSGLQEFKTGDIIIKDFSFYYNKLNPVFEQLNITIKENSCVLLKGQSGCGKSTLCQIISRLIEVDKNSILIGNINIHDYSLKTIRENITYVGQKENLIQETIKNNISFYRNINESLFKKVVDICRIEDIVRKKPLRYETYLLKDALNISGGEKQRIILARALLNNFHILILDEALSEVNEDLEIEIIKDIQAYFKNKTILYVSHKNHEKYFDEVINFGAIK